LKKLFSITMATLSAILLITATFTLPVYAEQTSTGNVKSFLDGETEDFLTPDQAFKLNIRAIDANTLNAEFIVADGHYLYRDKIKFGAKNNEITETSFPKGDIKQDPNFGETEVYHQNISILIKLKQDLSTEQNITIDAIYQGCSEKGLCYSPIKKTLDIAIADANLANPNLDDQNAASEDDQATTLLKGGKLWLIVAGFFGFGLLLALTPCVLPMIPILSGIIVGDKKTHHHATSRLHTFNLSLAYTLGMALSYTLAGIAAGLSGQLLSNALQSPLVLSATALIFVALALSMFGLYELRLPSSIENRMAKAANGIKGGQWFGVFIMGALSALIVSPCVAAPLAGALIYISQTHDVVLGGIALFSLSIGMGVPLLLIGASAGHVLPKAGPWMTGVRNFFGILMLALAIWMVSPILSTSVQMFFIGALFIIPAIYMHALDRLSADASGWQKLQKGIAFIALLLGIALLVGALSGAKSALRPLDGLIKTSATQSDQQETHLPFKRIQNIAQLEQAIQEAKGKTIMLDFYADWCVACKELEQFTFSNAQVKNALSGSVLLQVDVTENTKDDLALLNRFKLFGPPGIIFFNKSGKEVSSLKTIGYQDADKFLKTIEKLNLLKENECNPTIVC
jgi:thiol:disulfide interchange protein DsbD